MGSVNRYTGALKELFLLAAENVGDRLEIGQQRSRLDLSGGMATGKKIGMLVGIPNVDAHRRMIESYGEQEYDRTTYYEKWIRAVRNLIVEQEIVTREEIEAKMAEVRAKHAKAGRKAAKETIPW
jgi:hypothetical protein